MFLSFLHHETILFIYLFILVFNLLVLLLYFQDFWDILYDRDLRKQQQQNNDVDFFYMVFIFK